MASAEQQTADYVQVNIYGVTLTGLLQKGINIPYLLSLYGLEDCVVFDVPRRIPQGQKPHVPMEPLSLEPRRSFTPNRLEVRETGFRCSTPVDEAAHPLMNCSLSTIMSAVDEGMLENAEDFEGLSELPVEGAVAGAESSYEDTVINCSSPASLEVAEIHKKKPGDANAEEKPEENLIGENYPSMVGLCNRTFLGGIHPSQEQNDSRKRRSLSLIPSLSPSFPSPVKDTSSPEKLLFSLSGPTIKRTRSSVDFLYDLSMMNQPPSLMELSAAVSSIVEESPLNEKEDENFTWTQAD